MREICQNQRRIIEDGRAAAAQQFNRQERGCGPSTNRIRDAGATATDAIDGDIIDRIVVDNPVETAVLGTYVIRYNVKDLSGNSAVAAERTVVVAARTGGGDASGPLRLFC